MPIEMTKMNEHFLDALGRIKEKPVIEDWMIGINVKEALRVCFAWQRTRIQILPEVFDKCKNIWECVQADMDHFYSIAGMVNIDTFRSLIKANILYPDGDFNSAYMLELELRILHDSKFKN